MEHAIAMNPAATDHLPFFLPLPGQTDVLFNVMVGFLVILVFSVGLLYLRLHALPEHLSHGASKMQLQIVGVLCLLALFTHNHIYWIAALFIALIEFPDFASPIGSIARSLEKLSGRGPPEPGDAWPGAGDAPPMEIEGPGPDRPAAMQEPRA
jgi:multisubunit Na+/H+ antiporter MnhF subunit